MVLPGKTAIITGAGTGLGAGTAKLFAKNGANVVLIGRRAAKLEEVTEWIRAERGSALPIPGDITKLRTVRSLVAQTIAEFGGVDILVNCAARHPKWNYAHRVSLQHFDESFSVNLRAPFMLIREVIPSMLERGGGSIINYSSILGVRGTRFAAAYCASKAGLVNLTRAVALEYADKGIRVNCICRGGIRPVDGPVDDRHYTLEEQAMLAEAGRSRSPVPLGRAATPDEMAQTLLYLAGPHSVHVTGSVINADGGSSAG